MERNYSTQSLSSDDRSDLGSEFRMESVIYMSSCAATVFIGGLVTVGILLMTLLTALTVMLQSCETRENGLIESLQSDLYLQDYCKMAAFNAEINTFESHSLPEICNEVAVKYIKEGHYMRELNISVSLVQNYFNGITPNVNDHDIVLLDMDDFLTNNDANNDFRSNPSSYAKKARHMKHVSLVELYIKLESGGWRLILLSRKPETLRDATIDSLGSAGCGGWSRLIMRSEEGMKMDTGDYILKQKMRIESDGYKIRAVISSHMDMLVGPFIKTQNFKLPNPLPVAVNLSFV